MYVNQFKSTEKVHGLVTYICFTILSYYSVVILILNIYIQHWTGVLPIVKDVAIVSITEIDIFRKLLNFCEPEMGIK